MTAAQLFQEGKLQDALEAQIKEVKSRPADQGARLFLFELLAFAGDLDRACRHLDVLASDEPSKNMAVTFYQQLLAAEQARRKFFHDGGEPRFLLEPPDHVRRRVEAVRHLRDRQPAEAAALLQQVQAAGPPVQGQLNDRPFTSLRDEDDLFGTVLEVLAAGSYCWVPLEQVRSLVMNPPKFPRDLLWLPAQLELRDGQTGNVFLTGLYPGSHEHPDDQIKLGYLTNWKTDAGGLALGVGRHTYLADGESVGLLEWRWLDIQAE